MWWNHDIKSYVPNFTAFLTFDVENASLRTWSKRDRLYHNVFYKYI